MAKFIVEKSFWDLFPKAEIGIIILDNLDNHSHIYDEHPWIKVDLKNANEVAKKYITTSPLSECPVIKVWREAYTLFKKEKDNRSSIEALLKRIEKNKGVGSINPLVDIYNTTSLLYGLPCGGEDIASFVGDMRLKITLNGGDEFFALGDEENDPTLPGELCYLDDKGAVCRCWNWRDGQRTMLRESTTKAFMIIESVDPSRHQDLEDAMNYLSKKTIEYLNAKILRKTIINIHNVEIEL